MHSEESSADRKTREKKGRDAVRSMGTEITYVLTPTSSSPQLGSAPCAIGNH